MTYRRELIISLLALVAVAVWYRVAPEKQVPPVDLHPTMAGLSLGSEPYICGDPDQLEEFENLPPFLRYEVDGATVELDHANRRIVAITGGPLKTDRGTLTPESTVEDCSTVLGEPLLAISKENYLETASHTWDVGPGERVLRLESRDGVSLTLIAVDDR